MTYLHIISVVFFILVAIEANVFNKSSTTTCDAILENLVDEIRSYEKVKDQILDYVLKGDFKGKTYDELATFVDKFGARLSGTQVLEDSIDYIIHRSRDEGLLDITTESVEVPHWVRLSEKLTMLEPRIKDIAILGLGHSVSTPPEGITAEVIVFDSFEALEHTPTEKVKGKIVLFDPKFTTYDAILPIRKEGASKASAKGAVASLVRSIAPFSINSPHTGGQTYANGVTKIPTAAVSLEDADLIRRIYNRGEKIVLNLHMTSTYDTKISRNTLIDIKGSQNPDKLVIVSGHIDSWDVGQGAMDDGGGLFISWAAPVILKRLKLVPKRTLRAIFWTAEEPGLVGAHAYKELHKNELNNINFIMESDEGTFAPLGLAVSGSARTRCIVQEILKMFKSINASTLVETEGAGSDISVFTGNGHPGASLYNDNGKYFWFHHTEGDTMNVEDPHELDLGTAFWTAVSYIIADLSADMD